MSDKLIYVDFSHLLKNLYENFPFSGTDDYETSYSDFEAESGLQAGAFKWGPGDTELSNPAQWINKINFMMIWPSDSFRKLSRMEQLHFSWRLVTCDHEICVVWADPIWLVVTIRVIRERSEHIPRTYQSLFQRINQSTNQRNKISNESIIGMISRHNIVMHYACDLITSQILLNFISTIFSLTMNPRTFNL